MNKKIATIIAGILLIGIISAGLFTHFATITGRIEIKGPIFYLNGDGDLLLNEEPNNYEEFNITESGEILFISDNLGIDKLYASNFNFHIWAKKDGEPSYIYVELIKINSVSNSTICGPVSMQITTSNVRERDELSCSSEEINFDENDKLGVAISGNIIMRNYNSNKDEFARIEISAI